GAASFIGAGAAGGAVPADDVMDFAEIAGQEAARRGLEIAAAGSHNVILVGAPGSGKSSMAKAMSTILPPMTREEFIQTCKIYSVSGKHMNISGGMAMRPFRAPHYSASIPALLGGGSDTIAPGEVSLAHNGILFIDEYSEAPKSFLEALRGPLEDGEVTISRLKSKVSFPARFMLVAAANPCPCGYWGEGDRCTCTPTQRASHISKLSGPMMDRIDIHLWLHPVETSKLVRKAKAESSDSIAARVKAAREIQLRRFMNDGIFTNSQMSNRLMHKYCHLSRDCQDYLEKVVGQLGLSARGCTRIIKIARTIADLDSSADITLEHLFEASGYRFLDRRTPV
ncbi:MAG: YifB family Mg chelatase-like AAA ATPase, partial [Bacteroidales bacterium]|nr:YifB family Mg chelatase-like AAA ATPase [Bacteroidales bacterium]